MERHAEDLHDTSKRQAANMATVWELTRTPARMGATRFSRILEEIATLEVCGGLTESCWLNFPYKPPMVYFSSTVGPQADYAADTPAVEI
jgi:hypothetical protein